MIQWCMSFSILYKQIYWWHTTKFCHKVRCYRYGYFGRKAQNCRNTRNQDMNNSFNLERKSDEALKERGDVKSQETNIEWKGVKM